MLAKLSVSGRLIPGDADTVLAMHANQLAGTQMLLVRFQSDPAELGQAWYYVPRMLTDSSLLLLQSAGDPANPPAAPPCLCRAVECLGRGRASTASDGRLIIAAREPVEPLAEADGRQAVPIQLEDGFPASKSFA